MAEFTDRHVGKRVVAQSGSTVGEVTGVENGDLRVTVGEEAGEEIMSALDWDGRTSQQTHRLNDRYVSNIDEETIRLRV